MVENKADFMRRIAKFSVVGLSGVLVNQGLLILLHRHASFSLWLASLTAIEVSILTNFLLNDLWTWHDKHERKLIGRIVLYHVTVGITAYGVNFPLLLIATKMCKIPYFWANIVGIGVASGANFIINHFWTYKNKN